jgi:polysaccharide chain length determinant protein (PEP-CTERM system associated)
MSDTGNEAVTGFQLDDLIEILERRRSWIAAGVLGGLLAGFLAYLVLPASYLSSTTILVEPQNVPENYIKSTVTLAIDQRIFTLNERVTGYQSLNDLIEKLGVARLDPTGKLTREAIMASIRDRLDVEILAGKTGAPVFELSYSASDPQLAADVVKEIAGLFVEENLKDRARQATATAEFLDKELDRLRDEVAAQEKRIREFNFGAIGALPSQLDTNLRELDRLNLELQATLESQAASTQRVAMLRRQLGAGDGASDAPSSLTAMLRAAEQELLAARRAYTEEHPNVRHLVAEVEDLREQIRSAPRGASRDSVALDPETAASQRELTEASLALDASKRQEARIRKRIEDLQGRVEQTPQRQQELAGLTRDYENLANTYRDLLGKKYEASLARNLELAQKGERFKVLRPAAVPPGPSWPALEIVMPAGLVLGLLVAAIAIAISERRNPAFRSVERLTRVLGLPVFASIPRIDNDQIFETQPSGEVDSKLVAYTAPESSPAEQYRGFLPTFLEAQNCRVILVTSAARGDGKTLTTMNLAVTLASDLNKRVVVIDADLRRPRVHKVMKAERKRGLSTILKREARLEDCVVDTVVHNLSVLPAGPSVRNPITLLTDQTFLDVINEAKRQFDIVMIDSPPLLPVVDSKLIRKLADMALFVVRADATPRDAVVRSMKDLRDVAGVIFNQVSPGSFRRYYYYDAYSTYAYGEPVEAEEAPEVKAVA